MFCTMSSRGADCLSQIQTAIYMYVRIFSDGSYRNQVKSLWHSLSPPYLRRFDPNRLCVKKAKFFVQVVTDIALTWALWGTQDPLQELKKLLSFSHFFCGYNFYIGSSYNRLLPTHTFVCYRSFLFSMRLEFWRWKSFTVTYPSCHELSQK